ncbi:hypothetical protein CRG98_030408 [Punica granatum]|uniref:Uncharacterized protein n=1 Tax=Punica granatum TaxID=22663 RepID=A0A2I0IZT2_PUNGR|nr:hypothetical protein CRG98_030408 [Punica granatum]
MATFTNNSIPGEHSDQTIPAKPFRTSRLHLLLSGLRVHVYSFLDFASTFKAFRTSRPHLKLSGLRVHGLRVHIYCFLDFASTFKAFRTSRPHLKLSGLRVHGLRVHIYYFPDFVPSRAGQRSPAARDPAGPEIPNVAISAILCRIGRNPNGKGMELQQKYNSGSYKQDPARKNGGGALVWRNFGIGDLENPRQKTRLFSSIPAVSTPGTPILSTV